MKRINVILSRLFMVLGSLLILGGLMLFAYNHIHELRAEDVSNSILLSLQEKVEENRNLSEIKSMTLQEIELDGRRYLGVISIPSLDLELPVQADWDYEKIKDTPCVYSGSIQNGGLVILAHNYSTHFGRIHHLQQGDQIKLMNANGKVFSYAVEEVLVLDSVKVKEMSDSGYDLSLFTCTYDGNARVTVRCTLQNKIDRYPVIVK